MSSPVRGIGGEALLIAGKDLRLEARSRVAANHVLPFVLAVVLLFGFALDPDSGILRRATPGLFWVTVLFAAVLLVRLRRGRRAAATVALVAVVIRPQSRVILDLALILTMGACLLRGWELVLVDNQPGSSRWLGIVVYGALTWTIAVCGVMLRRLQR